MSMQKISYIALPKASQLNDFRTKGDFCDCILADGVGADHSISELAKLALGKMPKWVEYLMKLRNAIVGVFGLKTGNVGAAYPTLPKELRLGDKIGVFNVSHIDDREIILGENDKHLDFRISLLKSDQGTILSTWVYTHNIFGKAYLAVIMPFHRLITQHTAKRLIKLTS